MSFSRIFNRVASSVARLTGRPAAFAVCVLVVALWALSGPLFGFSDTWQLVINTGTTIVTFLMVFLIQNTQNRDGAAIQAKLDELIRTSAAQNAFIGIEHLTEEELDRIRATCEARALDRAARHHGAGKGPPADRHLAAHAAAGKAADHARQRAARAAEAATE